MISSHSTFLPLFRKIQDRIPNPIKRALNRFYHWEYAGISLITLVTLILHFIIINQPGTVLFDEYHYVGEARSIIAGQGPVNIVHPPLAKLFIISGIRLFGDCPFGWRFFSVVFGTIAIVLFYFICRRLNMPKGGPLLAAFVFAFENLNFMQSSLAMLDVYMVFFMLGGFLLYLSRYQISSGLSLCLSVLAKLTGVFAFITIGIDWLLDRRRKFLTPAVIIVSSVLFFLVLLTALDSVIFGYWINPIDRIRTMLTLSGTMTFATAFQVAASTPWSWLYQPNFIFYNYNPQYLLIISFTVWIVTIPVLIFMVWQTIKGDRACKFGLSWFIGTYVPIILLVLVTNRVTFLYYYYPVIGALCLGIGVVLAKLLQYWKDNKKSKSGQLSIILVTGFLFAHIVVFVLFSPMAVPFIKWLPL